MCVGGRGYFQVRSSKKEIQLYWEIIPCYSLIYKMGHPKEKSISAYRVEKHFSIVMLTEDLFFG